MTDNEASARAQEIQDRERALELEAQDSQTPQEEIPGWKQALTYGLRGLDYGAGVTRNTLAQLAGLKTDTGAIQKGFGFGGNFPTSAEIMKLNKTGEMGKLSNVLPIYGEKGSGSILEKGGAADITGRGALGFAADALLDPINLLTLGGASGVKEAGKEAMEQLALKSTAKEAPVGLEKVLQTGQNFAKNVGETVTLGPFGYLARRGEKARIKAIQQIVEKVPPNQQGRLIELFNKEGIYGTGTELQTRHTIAIEKYGNAANSAEDFARANGIRANIQDVEGPLVNKLKELIADNRLTIDEAIDIYRGYFKNIKNKTKDVYVPNHGPIGGQPLNQLDFEITKDMFGQPVKSLKPKGDLLGVGVGGQEPKTFATDTGEFFTKVQKKDPFVDLDSLRKQRRDVSVKIPERYRLGDKVSGLQQEIESAVEYGLANGGKKAFNKAAEAAREAGDIEKANILDKMGDAYKETTRNWGALLSSKNEVHKYAVKSAKLTLAPKNIDTLGYGASAFGFHQNPLLGVALTGITALNHARRIFSSPGVRSTVGTGLVNFGENPATFTIGNAIAREAARKFMRNNTGNTND